MRTLKRLPVGDSFIRGLKKGWYGTYTVLGKGGVYEELRKRRFGNPLKTEKKDIYSLNELRQFVGVDEVNIRTSTSQFSWRVISGWDSRSVECAWDILLDDLPDPPQYVRAQRTDYPFGVRVVTVEAGYFEGDNVVRRPWSELDIIFDPTFVPIAV